MGEVGIVKVLVGGKAAVCATDLPDEFAGAGIHNKYGVAFVIGGIGWASCVIVF